METYCRTGLTCLIAAIIMQMPGCGESSPTVRFISGLAVELLETDPQIPEPLFDYWHVSDDEPGEHVYSAVFGFEVSLKDYDVELSGIKIIAEVLDHTDPGGGAGDIWDDYGFLATDKRTLRDTNIAGWTNMGKIKFYIGLGADCINDSDPEPYTDYELPNNANYVFTLVNIRFIIPRKNISMDAAVWFCKAQYQHFWQPYGGMMANSISSVRPISTMGAGDIEIIPLKRHSVCPVSAPEALVSARTVEWMAVGGEPNDTNVPDPLGFDFDYYYEEYGWYQYRQDPATGYWYWDCPENIGAVWVSDDFCPDDANDMHAFTDVSEPLAYYLEYCSDLPPAYIEPPVIIVKSLDSAGGLFDWMACPAMLIEGTPTCALISTGFVLPMEFAEDKGWYYDSYGNFYMGIPVAPGGRLTCSMEDFYGDYNYDGICNMADYAILQSQWNTQYGYDIFNVNLDANKDGVIDHNDLQALTNNWLKERYDEY